MNAFESGARKAIPSVLVYAFRRPEPGGPDGEVLMIHRVSNTGDYRVGDYHAGKWNGLGGKCEPDESALEAARRELREESGLDLPEGAFRQLGILHFPNFKAHKQEDWIVWVFAAQVGEGVPGDPLKDCPEGRLEWVPCSRLLDLELWPGDREFLPFVVAGRPFAGTLWYRGQELARAQVQAL